MLARLRVPTGDLLGVEVPIAPGEVLSLEAPLAVVHIERDRGLADGDDGRGVAEVEGVVLGHIADLELPHGDELIIPEALHDDVLPRDEGGPVPTAAGDVLDDVHGSTLSCSRLTLHSGDLVVLRHLVARSHRVEGSPGPVVRVALDHPVLEEVRVLDPSVRLVEEHVGDLVDVGIGHCTLLHHEDLDVVHGSTLSCSRLTLHRSVVAERFFQPGRATLQTTSACSDLLLRQHDEGVEFHGGFPRADVEDPARRQLDPTIRGVRPGVEEGRLLRLGEFRRDLLELVGGHGRCHSFFFKDFVDQAS